MQEEIGTTAGAIWHALTTKGELSLAQLKKDVKGKPPLFDWAIGWLAREGKIVRCVGRVSSTLSEPQRMGSKTPKNQIRLRNAASTTAARIARGSGRRNAPGRAIRIRRETAVICVTLSIRSSHAP